MDKYKTLRESAEKATPGPWIAGDDEDSNRYLIGPETFPGIVTIPVVSLHSEANADYIAAANPATIQALLAERDALREALETARNGLQWYHDEHTELIHGCDHEAMAQIDAVLSK